MERIPHGRATWGINCRACPSSKLSAGKWAFVFFIFKVFTHEPRAHTHPYTLHMHPNKANGTGGPANQPITTRTNRGADLAMIPAERFDRPRWTDLLSSTAVLLTFCSCCSWIMTMATA